MQLTTRNANLGDLRSILEDQKARTIDSVIGAGNITAVDGLWFIDGVPVDLNDDGVTDPNGVYRPTAVADNGLAAKLDVPRGYLRKMRETRPDLYDTTVNGLLHGGAWQTTVVRRHGFEPLPEMLPPFEAHDGSFFLRTFRGDDGGEGVARAFLSNRYGIMDNLDVLVAAMNGIRDAGVPVDVYSADLTESRMMVRVKSEAVSAMAPTLLAGYRSPWDGAEGSDNPTVFAGFQIANSEVGLGAFSITPRLVVQVCSNGMTVSRDVMRAVHVGSRMEEGVVRWSADTERKALSLVQAKTRDAVQTFLTPAYVQAAVDAFEERAGEPVAADKVQVVTKAAGFSEEETNDIFGFFVKGGQMTLGGLANAATAYAQTVEDGEAAMAIEANAERLLVSV